MQEEAEFVMNKNLPDDIASFLDKKLAKLNKARKIPSDVRNAGGCFARNYRPRKRACTFSELPEITIEKFYSLDEVDESLVGAIEAMLIAGYKDKEIINSAIEMDLHTYNAFDIQKRIDEVRKSEHYAVMNALINHTDGFDASVLNIILGIVGAGCTMQAVMTFVGMCCS